MNIHVYTTTWNEEVIIPFFLKYYSSFCSKIVVHDNFSTDRTVEIVKSYPNTEIISFDTQHYYDELALTEIKNTVYKKSRNEADWVFVVDADEFIYHPDLINLLTEYKKQGINYPSVKGYEMLPNSVLTNNDRLPFDYPYGVAMNFLDKKIVLDPTLDAKFGIGRHFNEIPVNGTLSPTPELKLLHYKMLNLDYLIDRYKTVGQRRSQQAKDNNWSFHWVQPVEEITKNYNNLLNEKIKVI